MDTTTLANAIRMLSIDAIVNAGEGHQGVPLGMADIATALYLDHLKFNPADPTWPDRDRVVLSNGHGSMLLYSLLYLSGYRKVSLDAIRRFRELDSICAGHPEYEPDAGIEVTTGPLGQGIANAMGMAVAEAHQRARFGDAMVNHYTYAFVGDGCLQEGIGQETISLAGHLKLGHLIFLWDDNKITDDGSTQLSISEDVAARFQVAGWHVCHVDGHDSAAVSAAIASAKQDPRPSLIACATVIGRGLPRVQGLRAGHSARLFDDDAAAARELLNWPHPAFEIPADVLAAWRACSDQNLPAYQAWQAAHAALAPAPRQQWDRQQRAALPDGLVQCLNDYKDRALRDTRPIAGIMASAEINDLLGPWLPERLVGCADLEAPTSHKRGLAAFTPDTPGGGYLHCGIREHAMAAMANGMAAHGGVIPLAVTYLAFSDYERASIRMAALMGLAVKYVFSHDSIGVGRNGPTHQPVEFLASFRAMPNLYLLRPADAVEAAECWDIALGIDDAPCALVFAKQDLTRVREPGLSGNPCARGGYVLKPSQSGPRQVTLLATGSEVAIACEARARLEALGIATAVVSLPCWELFAQQTEAYRQDVLGSGHLRVGVEAAVRFGWDQWLSPSDLFIGMHGYGLSGPAEQLYAHFGISADAIVSAVQQRLA